MIFLKTQPSAGWTTRRLNKQGRRRALFTFKSSVISEQSEMITLRNTCMGKLDVKDTGPLCLLANSKTNGSAINTDTTSILKHMHVFFRNLKVYLAPRST